MSEKNVNVADTVEENTEEISGVGTYTFKKPTNINGEMVETIDYDFTALNGSNIRHARSELAKTGYVVAVKELDACFHSAMFAEAAGISLADVERFDMRDYENVADIAKDFLYGEE
jgi:hypothetical protein